MASNAEMFSFDDVNMTVRLLRIYKHKVPLKQEELRKLINFIISDSRFHNDVPASANCTFFAGNICNYSRISANSRSQWKLYPTRFTKDHMQSRDLESGREFDDGETLWRYQMETSKVRGTVPLYGEPTVHGGLPLTKGQ